MILESTKEFSMERSSSLEGERQFTFSANAKAFHVLISRLYSNKEGAVVREVCTNAYDSLVMAGRPQERFTIHLPDDLDPNFRVIDNGVGLDEESVYRLMTGVFNSAKEDSNATAGAYGLGSKCPFAITDTFTIISRFGGVKRHFMCFKNEAGVPSVLKTMEEELAEGEYPSGVEVVVPVAPSKFGRFEDEVRKQLFFFSPRPIAEGYSEAEEEKLYGSEGKRDQLTDRLYVMRRHNYPGSPSVIVKVGPVGYPVSWDSFLGKDHEMDEQVTFLRKINSINNHGACYVFDMKIGEVDVPPSRETIEFSEVTIANMKKATFGLKEKITKTYHDRIMEPKSPVDKVKRLNEMREELGDDLMVYLHIMDVFNLNFPEDLKQYLNKDYNNRYSLIFKDRFSWITTLPKEITPRETARYTKLVELKSNLKYDYTDVEDLNIVMGPKGIQILAYKGVPVPEMAKFEENLTKSQEVEKKEQESRHGRAKLVAEWMHESPDSIRYFTYDRSMRDVSGYSSFAMLVPSNKVYHTKPFLNSEELSHQRRDNPDNRVSIPHSMVASILSGNTLFIIKDRSDEINLRMMGAFNSLFKYDSSGKIIPDQHFSIILLQPEALHAANNYQKVEEAIQHIKAEFKKLFLEDMPDCQFKKLSQFPKGKNPKKEGVEANKAFERGPASGVTFNGTSLRWEKLNGGHYEGHVYFERGDERAERLSPFFRGRQGVRISTSAMRKGTIEHLTKHCGLISIDTFIQRMWKNGVNDHELYMIFSETKADERDNIANAKFNGLRSKGVDMGHGLLNKLYSNYEPWMGNYQLRQQKLGIRNFENNQDARTVLWAFKPPEGTRMYRQMQSIIKAMEARNEFASSRIMKAYLGAREAIGHEPIFGQSKNFNEDFKLFQECYNKHFHATQTV